VTRNLAPASGRVARTACARVLLRGGIDEKTGEALSASAVAERLAWCTALVQGMARRLAAGHWNPADLGTLAEGRDAADRPLPAQAWMALRRLGWAAAPQDGVTVNDRIVRMAQELAGRTLRSACWRDGLTRAITANWPATGATVIYVEDLRSMEARGMGRTLNTRLSQTVRGQIVERLRHIAAEHGIAVVTVPPRGTSRNCPRCLAPLRHCKAPDQPTVPGWKWARCPGCGWQGDRDHGAWQRIAARGLTHQAKTAVSRDAGTMTVRAVDAGLEARAVVASYASGRDRSKTGATPRRSTSRRAPRRRAAPSPPRSPGRGGQRPEGHARTARPPLPRAATRDQRVSTTCTEPARSPHRARGAALGAGFHRNAHATPPQREPDPHPPREHGITEDH